MLEGWRAEKAGEERRLSTVSAGAGGVVAVPMRMLGDRIVGGVSLLDGVSGGTTPVRGITLLFPDASFPFQSGGIFVSGFWVNPAASFEQSPPASPASDNRTGMRAGD